MGFSQAERGLLAKLMQFYEAKCKVLHPAWGNPEHRYRLDREWTETIPGEKDLGVLVHE